MTKFIRYINESFEDKIFGILDTFMKEKKLTSGKELLASDIWREIISYLSDVYHVKITIDKSPSTTVRGVSYAGEIIISIPDIAMTPKLKASILGTLFHEFNHTIQDRQNPALSMGYISTNGHGTFEYSMYFLQKIERESQAVSIVMTSVMSGYNIPDIIDVIKFESSKAKIFEEANRIFWSQLDSMDLEPNEFESLKSLFMVCGFVHSLHLQAVKPESAELMRKIKKELINKWNTFEKKFRKTYKKLHAYFLKYGII
jgi:hypothetical protein